MAKRELVKQTGEKTSGAAFQTSWSYWAEMNLDPRMERGNRKAETGRDHVHSEVYAREAERAKKQVEEEQKQARAFLLQAQKKEEELVEREAEIKELSKIKMLFEFIIDDFKIAFFQTCIQKSFKLGIDRLKILKMKLIIVTTVQVCK